MEIKFKNLIDLQNKDQKEFKSTCIFIAVLIILFLSLIYLKTQVFVVVTVSGESMCNTLQDQDLLVVNKKSSIERGDIIVFYFEERKSNLIKRVIGLPGDTIWTENGYVFRRRVDESGKLITEKLEEDYLLKNGVTKINGTVLVSEGCLYVLGDNREISSDSHIFGEISLNTVLGVVPDWSIENKDSKLVNAYKKYLFSK